MEWGREQQGLLREAGWDSPQGAESDSKLQLGKIMVTREVLEDWASVAPIFEMENMVQSALSQVPDKCRKHNLLSPLPNM